MPRFLMPRFFIALCIAAFWGAPVVFAQDSTEETAAEPTTQTPVAAEPAPLIDLQVTIVNQSGQMLMRFEVVPDLDNQEPDDSAPSTTEATTATTTDAPADAAAAPDPRLSAGGELLKGGVVSAGNFGILTVPGGASVCAFRILSTLQDGRTVDEQVDICLNSIYTLLPPS